MFCCKAIEFGRLGKKRNPITSWRTFRGKKAEVFGVFALGLSDDKAEKPLNFQILHSDWIFKYWKLYKCLLPIEFEWFFSSWPVLPVWGKKWYSLRPALGISPPFTAQKYINFFKINPIFKTNSAVIWTRNLLATHIKYELNGWLVKLKCKSGAN